MHHMAAVACMKSGMATMTASMFLPSLSSILRKSLYFGTFSYCLNLPAARFVIHVAERHDVLAGAASRYRWSLAARADGRDVQFLVGRFVAQRPQGRHAAESRGRNRAGQQRPEKEMRLVLSYATANLLIKHRPNRS